MTAKIKKIKEFEELDVLFDVITLRTSLGQCLGSAFTAYMTAQIQARIQIAES